MRNSRQIRCWRIARSLVIVLTLPSWGTPAFAQESGLSASTVSGTPWVDNRAIGEGNGIKTGGVEWHPGVSAEFGYDSNFLQIANSSVDRENYGPPAGSLRFRVIPQLSLRSLDRGGKGGGRAPMPPLMFEARAMAAYNEFIALDADRTTTFAEMRNIEGGAGVRLDVLPERSWSGQGNASYNYRVEPSNQGGGGETYNRHLVALGGRLIWIPGRGRFRWTALSYTGQATLFDTAVFSYNNTGTHTLGSSGQWRFLPKTSVLFDASASIVQRPDYRVNDGTTYQSRLGLNGLITKKLAFLAMGGWAASFYRNRNGVARNYSAFVTHLETKWFFSPDGKLKEGNANVGASAIAVGYHRDFSNSYIGDFYRRDRVYLQTSYLIGGRVVTTVAGGVSAIAYPDYYVDGVGESSGFNETRLDFQAFVEYRPLSSLGISLRLRYDRNASEVVQLNGFDDDLSFSRFRTMLGVRWFL